jgi:hypothetical protein
MITVDFFQLTTRYWYLPIGKTWRGGVIYWVFISILSVSEKKHRNVSKLHILVTFIRGEADSDTKERVKSSILSTLDQNPLLVFPEGATTNGKAILLFNKFVFSLGKEVQPIAIRVWSPWRPIYLDFLRDSFLTNMFALMFLPWTRYEYTILPKQVNVKLFSNLSRRSTWENPLRILLGEFRM